MKRISIFSATVVLAAAITAAALAGDNESGFQTARASMLTTAGEIPGVEIKPLLTVGDVLPSGFRFEAIPDGISLRTKGQGRVDLFVNHETSKVPFPFVAAAPTASNGENDFDNAQVSELILNQHSAGVLNGSFAVSSNSGFQRFCSNYLATEKEGFAREILFTNEESPDYVYRQEASWPPPIGDPAQQEAGLVVALDVKTGKHTPIYGMGRHNHENSIADPGVRQAGRALGRRHVHERPADGCVPGRRSALTVAALLLHRAEHGRAAGRHRRPLGLRLRYARCEELLQRRSRVRDGGHRALHQGAKDDRDRPQARRF